MASRRKLKKNINSMTEDLLTECFIQELVNPDIDKTKLYNLMERIYCTNQEIVSRISHTEPGNVKGFYRKLKDDFSQEMTDIISELVALG